ncbi:chitin synthase-domain-containing protein [Sporodiniella umbellata]|nr:chitin synthase-domain-containing protein [Sporodiniella umbellata]
MTKVHCARQTSCRRIVWVAFAKCCTFLFPDALLNVLGLTTQARKGAWREKVALFCLYLWISAFFCFWLEYLTTLFCDPPKSYSYQEVYSNQSAFSSLHGKVIYWENEGNRSAMTQQANRYPHLDLSPMFPNFMLLQRANDQADYANEDLATCISRFNRSAQADRWLSFKMNHDPGYLAKDNRLISCPIPGHRNQTGSPCFYTADDWDQLNGYPKKGAVSYSESYVSNCTSLPHLGVSAGQAYVILDNEVLDVTDYLQAVTDIVKVAKGSYSRSFAVERMFFPLELTMLLFISLGTDITEDFYSEIPNAQIYQRCLSTLFYHGMVEGNEGETGCAHINLALWITMGCFLLYFLIKMNLTNLSRLSFVQRVLFKSHARPPLNRACPHILLLIPFFSEPAETIRYALDSLARTTYPDSRKMLFFVCDGVSLCGDRTNYRHVLDALGYSASGEPEARAYVSLGQGQRRVNYARVYAGFYESGRHRVPFMMVVKVGSPDENGNRGKRDSLLIVLSFLERSLNPAHHRIQPLEFELYHQCSHLLGIQPSLFKYLLVADADMQVQDDVLDRLAARLEADPRMLAVSGHVRPANPEENLVTMLQIFPIYMTHYASLAYEACLGRLTTLNSGFVMYRLWEPASGNPPVRPSHRDSKQVPDSDSSSDESEEDSAPAVTTPPELKTLHPTVLRSLAGPRPDTMHLENMLLLGEDLYLGLVLLRSHPHHRFGFEPEAVAYTRLPSHFLGLQALQLRHLRATLHTQLEFQQNARHLGLMYWFLSMTKLLDMIFSLPIIVYLYNVFIRYFISHDLAYAIIAGSFAGLIVLYVFYFVVRRQFKYILWFVLYCLVGVPLFHLYFPLCAVWCSDQACRWYDVWPTAEAGYRGRPHGSLSDQPDDTRVDRLRLQAFELLEAEKSAQRAKEAVAQLDAQFKDFTAHIQNPFDDIHSKETSTLHSESNLPAQLNASDDSCHHSILSLEPYQLDDDLAEGRNVPVHSKIA